MILVTRFSALGDIAMTIPALYDACRANPGEQFLMLTRKGPAKLFVNPPANLKVVGVDLNDFKGVKGLWRLADKMKQAGVDRMVDLHGVLRTIALRNFLSMRGVKVSVIRKGRAEKRSLTRDRKRKIHPLQTTLGRYRDTFRRAGLKTEPSDVSQRFRSVFPPEGADPAVFAAATPPKTPGERWIGVAPFARHKGKVYPAPLMLKVLEDVSSRPDTKVFIFAGGPEEEKLAAEWCAELPGMVNLAPLRLGFKGEMALMNHCETVLSMDSANMHMASLAGTRVVSVWGATHPYCGFMGFNQKNDDTVQLDMSCRPCSVFGDKPCRRGDYHCLHGIAPARVVKALGLSVIAGLLLPGIALARGIFNPEFPPHRGLPPVVREMPAPEDPAINTLLTYEATDALLRGDFQKAYALYREVRPGRLPLCECGGYWYGLASAAARLGFAEEVDRAAAELSKAPGMAEEAGFLKAYSAYRSKDFAAARKMLANVSPRFMPELYLAQIDFQEGNWERAAISSDALIPRLRNEKSAANAIFLAEALRVGGISRFKEGKDDLARPLLEEYIALSDGFPSADAVYSLGQIEYAAGKSDKAKELLQPLLDAGDWFSQAAAYTIAQADAASGADRQAALGFSRAARLNFDPTVGQNAIYNYIASGTRGATVPFSSAASMYAEYLDRGEGTRHDASLALRFAREFAREGNYEKALESINRIASPDHEAQGEKQKILYLMGRTEVQDRKFAAAAIHLKEGAAITADPALGAECQLWLGDALYSMGEYGAASARYTEALKRLKGANRTLALYNDAYALFSQDDFKKAAKRFREALDAKPGLAVAQREDARLREADCLFYTGRYAEALRGYTEASRSGNGADYAAMRRATVLGLTGDTEGKIAALRAFPQTWPGSRWQAEVALELGNTLESLDRHGEAVEVFAAIASSNPDSPQGRLASLARAQSLVKGGNPTEADAAYRDLIKRWPSSEEAAQAVDDLMKLSASMGTLASYSAFLESVPGAPRLDAEKMEDLAFDAAEDAWADNISDTWMLKEYLRQYPDGRYAAQAWLDIAQSEAEAGNASAALEAFLQLERKGGADYAPEAYAGIMHFTGDKNQRGEYAAKVLTAGGVEPEMMEEARLFAALEALDDAAGHEDALSTLGELASHPDRPAGARAAVELGEWQLSQNRTADAVKTITAFTDAGSPHSYWLARGFIALSDAIRKQGNSMLADEYLRSLKENYPGNEPDILSAISKRLK